MIASWALFRIFGLWSTARFKSPATALRGPICVCPSSHAAESCATNNDSRHPIEGLRSGASASGSVNAGARLVRICENFDWRSGCGAYGVTTSRRYTTEVANSLFTPELGVALPRRARSPAKYPVGVGSVFWSRRMSSSEDRTI